MIKKFIQRLLGQGETPGTAAPPAAAPATPAIPLGQRTEISASEHRIDPQLLDANAVRVVKTLKDAGFEAYIVGGAVRDLLVGLRPKDFDVATDATPEQVKSLFRRAFIIGRRFRLVHVVFGRGREHETIEVSTFRAYMDPAATDAVAGNEKTAKSEIADKKHVVDASGRVLRDNVWGPQIEDAARRDFTINAMYYDPVTQTVVDYHGGLADVRARLLRMIGDPATRYREDPVRIIRVVRFAAKLGFALEPATLKPIAKAAPLLSNVPISRLFDEMVKLMQTGHALASVEQLRKFGLIGGSLNIFPVLDAALAPAQPNPVREKFVRQALQDTDTRVAENRSVVPSYMLACMLWHDVQERWATLRAAGEPPVPALQQAIDAVFDARIGDISGRGKLAADMREVWLMQPRFERRTPSGAASLVAQPRFRAGYDFLRLRADCGEVPQELADWWEDFHLGNDEDREALLRDVKPAARGAKRVPARGGEAPRAGTAPAAEPGDGEDDADDDADDGDSPCPGEASAAPRKRRRRRRRPGGGRPAGGGEGGPPAT
ncbi:polynucleotide adenylyltransferase PcnB [Rubrivivax rivuli]|uniref:Poly(A) polymerase I n=1 Tax=Rubrivivax rivuli TaxID=1862385 RepID=A0A437RHV7_9BURK|nr:polynucleotide adenylyltransferase PcnB [Rubrivivax rivuli]RVU46334.1 polynucleotide adenylyltransferase PcnB [Rubrivivax rivuli]